MIRLTHGNGMEEETYSSAASSLESLLFLPLDTPIAIRAQPVIPNLPRPLYLADSFLDSQKTTCNVTSSSDNISGSNSRWPNTFTIMDEDEEEEDMDEPGSASRQKSGFGEWVDKFGLGSLSIFNKGSQKHDQQQQQQQHRHVVQPSIEQGIFTEKRISATIVGYEILHHQEKYTIFKIRVDNLSEWSVDTVPVWHIFRRYSEMLTLFQKIRTSFPLHPFEFPPRKWLGNQFDPLFIGRRIQRLQGFLCNILDDPEVRDHEIVRHFFCFDAPPNRTSIPLEFDRAIFDTFEEVVHELREQLRAREILEATTHDQREMLKERDLELDVMRTEIDTLRRQKDSLLKALGDDSNVLSLPVPSLGRSSLHNSRLSLVSHHSSVRPM